MRAVRALPQATGGGAVVVFDDITQLVQAQRATAWAEVARRLAHEIKNPLTPIQLSAERLAMKLGERLPPEDAETLRRSTETIVNQVAALKAMVDDFRDYARLPAPEPAPLDLNRLVRQVLALYENSSVPIAKDLAEPLPPVWADGAQIRQVIHNLVQNAQDALENLAARGASPAIEVRTELAGDRVRLAVSDNGGGFPEELMARIFEPYVTTKPRGTGLGLAIVKKIVDEHHGAVTIENRPSRGASVQRAAAAREGGVAMAQILVVDDEVGIRELLSEILADEGHQVLLAEKRRRRAPPARARRAPTSCCSTSGCPTPTASRC